MMLTSNEWPWEEKNDALLKKMKQNSQNSNIVEDPKIFYPFVFKNNAKKKELNGLRIWFEMYSMGFCGKQSHP